LIVLVRNLPQLEAALKCGVTTVYCEFEDPKKYREAGTTSGKFTVTRGAPVISRHPSPSTVTNLRRSPAHFQTGRGMDA
jgi:putative protease